MTATSIVVAFGGRKFAVESRFYKRMPSDYTDANGFMEFFGDNTFIVGLRANLNFDDTMRVILHEAGHIAFTILQGKRKHPRKMAIEDEEAYCNLYEDVAYGLLKAHIFHVETSEVADEKN